MKKQDTKPNAKRLVLNKERIRSLDDARLVQVIGGSVVSMEDGCGVGGGTKQV